MGHADPRTGYRVEVRSESPKEVIAVIARMLRSENQGRISFAKDGDVIELSCSSMVESAL